MLHDVNQTLSHQKLHIDVPQDVQEKLVDLGYSATMVLAHCAGPSKIKSKTGLLNIILSILKFVN